VRSSGGCQDNLLAKSRVAALSAMERRALDAHLGVCELCRATVTFGTLFDAIPDHPPADDEALVRRLVDRRITGPRGATLRRRQRALALAAGIALFVVAGAALAWVSSVRRTAPQPEPTPSSTAQLAAPRRPIHARPLAAVSPREDEPPVAPVLAPPPAPASPSRRSAASTRARARTEAARPNEADETAAALFARANSTRRAQDFAEAIRQYQALQRRFPGSSEARVSLVSMGDLLSRAGDAAGALAAFNRYLSERDAAPLAPEALYGRARCLERLGRRADELSAWRELRARFPGSVYEAFASRRVDELSR
jgi:TolA-binding protein